MIYGNTDWWEDEYKWIEEAYGVLNKDGEFEDQTSYAYEMRAKAEAYRLLIDIGVKNSEDWRYELAFAEIVPLSAMVSMGYSDDTELLLELRDYARRDDWKGYYAKCRDEILSTNEMSDIQKEAYAFKYSYHLENDLKPYTYDWKDSLIRQASNAKMSLVPYLEAEARGEDIDPEVTEDDRNKLALAMYQLENDVQDNAGRYFENERRDGTYWSYFVNASEILTIIGIMMIIIAGKIVAEEYSAGTIKFLLISPAKRYKILLSKYLTVLLMGIMMMATLYLSSAILALPFSGGKGFGYMVLTAKDGVVRATSPFISLLVRYALQSVGMIVMATMAFAISALMRSTAVSVGVGIAAYGFGLLGVTLLAELNVDVGRYVIFSNLDLAAIANGEAIFEYQTLPMALMVIGVHMFLFLLTAHDAFVRRDI